MLNVNLLNTKLKKQVLTRNQEVIGVLSVFFQLLITYQNRSIDYLIYSAMVVNLLFSSLFDWPLSVYINSYWNDPVAPQGPVKFHHILSK